ncbi:unnamed protein product [Caenorhabditis sp. 36 PRJEB53466]|nr:unnamed protein product [Caenorhabditis sp. 36 PRJEB53466]
MSAINPDEIFKKVSPETRKVHIDEAISSVVRKLSAKVKSGTMSSPQSSPTSSDLPSLAQTPTREYSTNPSLPLSPASSSSSSGPQDTPVLTVLQFIIREATVRLQKEQIYEKWMDRSAIVNKIRTDTWLGIVRDAKELFPEETTELTAAKAKKMHSNYRRRNPEIMQQILKCPEGINKDNWPAKAAAAKKRQFFEESGAHVEAPSRPKRECVRQNLKTSEVASKVEMPELSVPVPAQNIAFSGNSAEEITLEQIRRIELAFAAEISGGRQSLKPEKLVINCIPWKYNIERKNTVSQEALMLNTLTAEENEKLHENCGIAERDPTEDNDGFNEHIGEAPWAIGAHSQGKYSGATLISPRHFLLPATLVIAKTDFENLNRTECRDGALLLTDAIIKQLDAIWWKGSVASRVETLTSYKSVYYLGNCTSENTIRLLLVELKEDVTIPPVCLPLKGQRLSFGEEVRTHRWSSKHELKPGKKYMAREKVLNKLNSEFIFTSQLPVAPDQINSSGSPMVRMRDSRYTAFAIFRYSRQFGTSNNTALRDMRDVYFKLNFYLDRIRRLTGITEPARPPQLPGTRLSILENVKLHEECGVAPKDESDEPNAAGYRGEAPWAVGLVFDLPDPVVYKGATLITPRHVLFSADAVFETNWAFLDRRLCGDGLLAVGAEKLSVISWLGDVKNRTEKYSPVKTIYYFGNCSSELPDGLIMAEMTEALDIPPVCLPLHKEQVLVGEIVQTHRWMQVVHKGKKWLAETKTVACAKGFVCAEADNRTRQEMDPYGNPLVRTEGGRWMAFGIQRKKTTTNQVDTFYKLTDYADRIVKVIGVSVLKKFMTAATIIPRKSILIPLGPAPPKQKKKVDKWWEHIHKQNVESERKGAGAAGSSLAFIAFFACLV